MVEVDGTLIMSILREIREDIRDMKRDIADLKLRVHVLEEQYGSMAVSMAGINHRMDRFQDDLSTIKRRLNLVDAE